MDENGYLTVRFPNIRWEHLRSTEGWAALQYHALLHSTFTVFPPSILNPQADESSPQIEVDLLKGSFFAILPFDAPNNAVPEWHAGNIYEMVGQSESVIELPGLSWTEPTCFHILVSGDYEVRTSYFDL
jgi:hypothetical protein